MKDKILDAPFENEFHFKLEENEDILWENDIFFHWDFSHKGKDGASIFFVGILFYSIPTLMWLFSVAMKDMTKVLLWIVFVIIILVGCLLLLNKKNHKRYIITSKRIIFHKGKDGNNFILNLPLTDIKTIDVAMKGFSNTSGDILLEVKDLDTKENVIHFSNYDPNLESPLIKLVIPNIKNTPKTLKLIRQARLKAKGL